MTIQLQPPDTHGGSIESDGKIIRRHVKIFEWSQIHQARQTNIYDGPRLDSV